VKIPTAFTLMLLSLPCWSQSDLVFPWVTNNSQFRGRIFVNNLGSDPVTAVLTATRPAGEVPQTQTVQVAIGPYEQFQALAGDLFDELGEGKAYMIRLTSESDGLQGGFINISTGSVSQSSPSQSNVFLAADAAPIILFNLLSIFPDGDQDGTVDGFSAPVVINLGDSDAEVMLHAFQDGMEVGTTTQTIAPNTPFSATTASLFPGLLGDFYVVADGGNQPLLGTAFIFNFPQLEPSMANAVAINGVPNPKGPGGGEPTVSFRQDVLGIFTRPIGSPSCGSGTCHLNARSEGGLNLDIPFAYNNLVNVPSEDFPEIPRVDPGHPENSYLYMKLLPDGQLLDYMGDRMPFREEGPLTDEEIQIIYTWIKEGAPNN